MRNKNISLQILTEQINLGKNIQWIVRLLICNMIGNNRKLQSKT